MTPEIKVLENLTEDEAYLFAILSDPSGLDQAEFLFRDDSSEDNMFCPHCGTEKNGVHLHDHAELEPEEWVPKYQASSACWRAWAFQWSWWKCQDTLQIDQAARSLGKSLSILIRACAFPWLFPGQEMIVTAPELVHLEPIVSLIENRVTTVRTLKEMIPVGRSAITHRPFQLVWRNGARLIGRIPQRDGRGVKGLHPIWLELDECLKEGTLILTRSGFKAIESVEVGDEVWTHRSRWRMVTGTYDRGVRDTVKVRGQGHPGLICTANHKCWARQIVRWMTPSRKEGPVPAEPTWIPARDLEETYWASPKLPAGAPLPEPLIERAPVGPSYEIEWRHPDFLWMFGLFLAEGSLSSSYGKGGKLNRSYWSIHTDEVEEVVTRAKRAGLSPKVHPVQNTQYGANVLVTHQGLAAWLNRYVGRASRNLVVPTWVYSLTAVERMEVLSGIVYGDGHNDKDGRYAPDRWKATTVSRGLMVGIRILAQSLGYYVSCYESEPKGDTTIRGRSVKRSAFFQVVGNTAGQGLDEPLARWTRIRSVSDHGPEQVYDLAVEDDNSFVADGVIVHNSQDFPHAGWIELNETLKRGWEGATWRAHGVTRGVRDDFYNYTQDSPDNPWTVHRLTAMLRPNWTDRERQEAIQKYGSREDPDYRRNILGQHGDKTNPIFVAAVLFKNVDPDKLSDYNANEYLKVVTKSEQLELFGQQITEVLDFPPSHLAYAGRSAQERLAHPQAHYWIGMDVGLTIDPSEILVFVEYRKKPTDPRTVLRLLTRISMVRMPHHQQMQAILHTIDFYRPQAFAMDKGGIGLSIYQELTEHMEAFRNRQMDKLPAWMHGYDLEKAVTTIKGYHFGEKVLVDLDPAVEVGPYDDTDEIVAKSGMRRNAKEFGTDVLREMVDRQQLWLPWDDDLLKQFQGGTWTSSRSMDLYGKRTFSSGNDHCLDAARMMALGWSLNQIEEMTKKTPSEPVLDSFIIM